MFIYQLRLPIASQENAKIVKPGDYTLQFHAIDQKDCDRDLGLAHMIQERILKVLSVRRHWTHSLFFLLVPADQAPPRAHYVVRFSEFLALNTLDRRRLTQLSVT